MNHGLCSLPNLTGTVEAAMLLAARLISKSDLRLNMVLLLLVGGRLRRLAVVEGWMREKLGLGVLLGGIYTIGDDLGARVGLQHLAYHAQGPNSD